jgi:hypothetical protein
LTSPDGPDGEEAVRGPLERHALAQHLVDLGAAVGDSELAAVEPADLAVCAVRAERLVDLPKPAEREPEVDGLARVDADRHAHDVADLGGHARDDRGGHRLQSPPGRGGSGCARPLGCRGSYRFHVIQSGGKEVHVLVSKAFKVTGVQQGGLPGGAPPAGQRAPSSTSS